MECTGKVTETTYNWGTGKMRITFEINERTSDIDEIAACEKLNIKAEKYREKRSLDANAYAWHLLQKLAEANKSDKWTMYLQCLQRYSRAFTHVIVKAAAVEKMKEFYRTCIDLGEVSVNGQAGHQLQVYFGSSTFDSKEMSVFIDGIVSECQELGIDTKTPEEIARMKAIWQ